MRAKLSTRRAKTDFAKLEYDFKAVTGVSSKIKQSKNIRLINNDPYCLFVVKSRL